MCDSSKLRGKMTERSMTQEALAKSIGIDRSTLNRKLKNLNDFTIGEAEAIAKALQLTGEEAVAIFFTTNVA